jgi:hypothetical protein
LLVALPPIPRSEQRGKPAVPLSLAALVCFSAKADMKRFHVFMKNDGVSRSEFLFVAAII